MATRNVGKGSKRRSPLFGENTVKQEEEDEVSGFFAQNMLEVQLEETGGNLEGIVPEVVNLGGSSEESEMEVEDGQEGDLKEVVKRLKDQLMKAREEKETLKRENGRLNERVKGLEKKVYDMNVIAKYKFGTWKTKLRDLRTTIRMMVRHGRDEKRFEELARRGLDWRRPQESQEQQEEMGNEEDDVILEEMASDWNDGEVGSAQEVGVSSKNTRKGQPASRRSLDDQQQRNEEPGPSKRLFGGDREIMRSRSANGAMVASTSSGTPQNRDDGRDSVILEVEGSNSVEEVPDDAATTKRMSSTPPDIRNKFLCNICDVTCAKASLLKKHKKNVHGIDDPGLDGFGCVDCGLTFPNRKEHARHRIRVHGMKVGKPKKVVSNLTSVSTLPQASTSASTGLVPPSKTAPVTLSSRLKRRRHVPRRLIDTSWLKREVESSEEVIPSSLIPSFTSQQRKKNAGIRRFASQRMLSTSEVPSISSAMIRKRRQGGSTTGLQRRNHNPTPIPDGTAPPPKHGIAPPDPLTDVGDYKCLCGQTFERRAAIRMHILRKNRGKLFKCYLCSSSFDTHMGVKVHVRKIHNEEYAGAKFACGICGLVAFDNAEELRRHRLVDHKRAK